MPRFLRVAVLATTFPVFLSAACSSLPETGFAAASTSLRPNRASIQSFDLEGRIVTRQEDRHLSGKVSWRHTPQRDELLLSNPLGQGMAELSRDSHGAALKLADRREFFAADWDTLAAQLFDLPLPLSSLSGWLVGNIPHDARQISRDAQGRPRSMTLQGWRIDYPDYESEAPDALPSRLELHQGNIEVRLKIDAWRLEDAGASP